MADTATNLTKRQEKLETILQQRSQISNAEKCEYVKHVYRENDAAIVTSLVALATGTIVSVLGYKLYQHTGLTESYEFAHDYVDSLTQVFQNASHSGVELTLTPEMLEAPRELVVEGASKVYAEEAAEITQYMSDIAKKLPEASGEETLKYLDILKGKLICIADSSKEEFLKFGTGMFSIITGIFGSAGIFTSIKGDWEGPVDYRYKKLLRKELKKDLPTVRAELPKHPHAKVIYDFLDARLEKDEREGVFPGVSAHCVFDLARYFNNKKEERYAFAFQELEKHQDEFLERSTQGIKNVFIGYVN